MVFEAVDVDTVAKEIVAHQPDGLYRGQFALCPGLREEAGLLVTERYAQLAGIGDPKQGRAGKVRPYLR